MFFDDTFPHEVWNDTDSIRVVLFMDIPFRRHESACILLFWNNHSEMISDHALVRSGMLRNVLATG